MKHFLPSREAGPDSIVQRLRGPAANPVLPEDL